MENLYFSLYDLLNDDDNNDNSEFIDTIGKISGNHDINAQSKYYNIDEYTSAVNTNTNYYTNIIHLNIRSLSKNFDLLRSMLNCLPKHPDVIALTETWLNNTNKHLYQLDGYSSFHLVRTTREHGGISIFVKNDIHTHVLHDYCFINEDSELYTVKIRIDKVEHIIATLYRPHSKHIAVNNFTDIITNTLSADIFTNNKTIILGDLNINLLEHSIHLPTNIFINAMQTMNYFPHISRPTRFPDNPQLGAPSLLDHVWTNFSPPSLSGILCYNISDHLPIFINIAKHSALNTRHRITFRDFSKNSHDKFTQELLQINWEELYHMTNANESFNYFIDIIIKLYNKCFPIKTKFVTEKRLQNPWLTRGLMNSIKHKFILFKQSKLGIISHATYKIYRNNLTKAIRNAKCNYYSNFFSDFKNNTKKIWQAINTLKGNSQENTKINSLKLSTTELNKPLDIAEAFSTYFSNIAPQLDSQLPNSNVNPNSYLVGNYPQSMVVPILTTHDLNKVIQTIKNKKSGINDIAVTVVKRNTELLSAPLAFLVNLSITSGTFPAKLKNAVITPIYKSGPNDNIKNYRPISQLSIFSKIFESAMKTYLMQYLEHKNILNKAQFGFRPKCSTFHALNAFSNDILASIDKKLSVLSIFVDFSKAFDTVNHNILLDKMHFYGIRGTILSWFRDYLSDRQQQVRFQGEMSSFKTVTLGVPQGSVLGPILFLIYINDISNIFLNSKTILFADDMTIYLIGPSPEQLVMSANEELTKLHQWCLSNRLTINTDKTHFMIFTCKRHFNLPQLSINEYPICRTSSVKFLGVTYDDSMTFKFHINNLTLKFSRHIALLYQVKDFIPQNVLKCIYYAHIYPLLTYCNLIWSTTFKTYLVPLKIQLKKIVRIITNSNYLAHTDPLFKLLNILKLEDITKLSAAQYMFTHSILGENLLPSHDHSTRHRGNLLHPAHRTNKFRHSVLYIGPVVWNTIPHHIKNVHSLSIFKKKFKRHILNSY